MENREIAIRLSGVKKRYKLGQIGGGTLQGDLQSWWARVRGREDPNAKIGTDQRLLGQTFYALNGIDLTVYKGEALGIIGSNGAGKSTMLKLLSRVTAPTEGEIDIYGRIASMLEVGTGFHGEMTGRENIYMNGAILGMTRAEIDAKMEDIIEFSEVREFIDTPVKRYSSGMYVKLAFSVAAHLDSEIMIMDEVLAVGDVNFQQKCLKKMRDAAKKEGRTVLYVSHNMSTIRALCDKCVVMDKGRIIYEGDVDTAISYYSRANDTAIQKVYDLTITDRREVIKAGLANVLRMRTLNLTRGAIEQGGSISFSILMESQKFIENAMLRLVLFNQYGEPVGMTYSNKFSCNSGKNLVEFEFDTHSLSPDSYYTNLIICEFDGQGQIRHDVANKAFAFKVMETNILYNMKWYRGWGNTVFNTIKVLSVNSNT